MELASKDFKDAKEVIIMPVGDIQWTGEGGETALDRLEKHIQWGVDQGAYFLGMGDYIDAFSPSNRENIVAARLYDSARHVIDQAADDLIEELYDKVLAPSKGRWLGLLEGHHFHEDQAGITSDQKLCKLLAAPFLGSCAYVRLRFTEHTRHGNVLIWCHHGVGGGIRAGAPMNRLDLLPAYFDADVFLIGHHHKKIATPIDRVAPVYPRTKSQEPRLVHRTVMLACTGGFLKGYPEQHKIGGKPRGGYVERRMLNPVALGGIVLRITPRWPRVYGEKETRLWTPDIHVQL